MRFLSTLVASALGTLVALSLVVFVFFFFIFAIALSGDDTPDVETGSVLVVELDGVLPETVADDPFARAFADGPVFGLRSLKEAFEKAAADERIDGVWLQMKGLNASWATLQEVRTALETYKASGKPLIASSDDYSMTESDYYLASVADSVFASREAFFEFNGFDITVSFFEETLNKLNVEPQVIRAGEYKSAVEPFIRRDLSPSNEEQLSELLAGINTEFMQAVAQSRRLSADSLRTLASDAAVLTAQGALSAGLLDGLRYHDEVAASFRALAGDYEEGEDLRTTSMSDYVRVPRSDAGIEIDGEGEIAVVYGIGQIVSGEGEQDLFGGPTTLGAETFNEAMREARESESVDAVVVRINSPGGSAAASDAMWREISLTSEVKPVIISMGDVAASGGYWMATAGDAIVADPLTITGSIGVFAVLFDASGFFEEKLGVTFDGVQTSPYADILSGIEPLSPEERRLMERFVDETYQTFLERVAASQDLSVEEVDAIARGRVWTGEDAARLGLVDRLGGLEDALALAAERAGLEPGGYRTRVLPRPKSVLEQFEEALSARASAAWVRWNASPIERALLEQQQTFERLAREHGTAQARLPFDLRVR